MIGMSPRVSTLTPQQKATSAAVAQSVSQLPTSVTDLISELAVPDFSLATQPVEISDDGRVVLAPRNLEIIAMIELALNAPSSECDPAIKVEIFEKALLTTHHFGNVMQTYLGKILNAMKDKGLQVILDDVELRGIDMGQTGAIDLGGMSAQRATFHGMVLEHLKMDGADFTGAKFISTSLKRCDMSKANISAATFVEVQFQETAVSELRGNQSVILKSSTTSRKAMLVDEAAVEVDDVVLNTTSLTASPDMEDFTLSAKNIIGPTTDEAEEVALPSYSIGFSLS